MLGKTIGVTMMLGKKRYIGDIKKHNWCAEM